MKYAFPLVHGALDKPDDPNAIHMGGSRRARREIALTRQGDDIVIRATSRENLAALMPPGEEAIELNPETSTREAYAAITISRAELERIANLDWSTRAAVVGDKSHELNIADLQVDTAVTLVPASPAAQP